MNEDFSPPTIQPAPYQKENKREKRLLFILIILLVLAALGGGFWWWLNSKKQNQASNQQTNQAKTDPGTVRLIATGDMIPHDAINLRAETDSGYDYFPMLENMKPFFDKADVRFCNQATPAGGSKFGVTGFPVFNAPTEFSRDMAKLGCNVINTASNHSFDKGQEVINTQLDYWDSLQNTLAVAGANRSAEEQNKIRYFEAKGVKFAFLAYSTYFNSPPSNGYGVNQFSDELAASQLAEARSKSDIVIVSMRWGTEYLEEVNPTQKTQAKFLSDHGADIIVGHGPHVLQPVDKFENSEGRQTIVWYSLGNFLNAQLEIPSLFSGIAVMDIDAASKKIKNISYLPVYMHYEWTAEEKAREDLLKRQNFKLYTLDTAAELLQRSQNKTTADTERDRITKLLNQYTAIPIIHDSEY